MSQLVSSAVHVTSPPLHHLLCRGSRGYSSWAPAPVVGGSRNSIRLATSSKKMRSAATVVGAGAEEELQQPPRAAFLAIGTANPMNCVPQDEYADYYFRITKSEQLTRLKNKMKRICDNSAIKKRYFHHTEDLIRDNPEFVDQTAASLDARLNITAAAVAGPCPRLRTGPSSGGHLVVPALSQPAANLGRVTAQSTGQFQGHSSVATLKSCQPPDDPTVNTANKHENSTRISIPKDKFFEVEMRVRDDDLDEYGVVNNAIYASYIHDARNVLLETLGIDVHFWTSTGNTMALSELQLKYFMPLRSGDRFVVKLRVVQVKGVRIIVDHMIESLPNLKLIMEARATAVCLDENHRPTRVFPELASKLRHFFSY